MSKRQSKTLWSVKFVDRAGFRIGSTFLVLGDTPAVAVNKATRALTRQCANRYARPVRGARVDEIKAEGTIDAF